MPGPRVVVVRVVERRFGALVLRDVVLERREQDPELRVRRLHEGRGVPALGRRRRRRIRGPRGRAPSRAERRPSRLALLLLLERRHAPDLLEQLVASAAFAIEIVLGGVAARVVLVMRLGGIEDPSPPRFPSRPSPRASPRPSSSTLPRRASAPRRGRRSPSGTGCRGRRTGR